MSIRVGVVGAGGRMGATVCQAVASDPALELVAAVDPQHAGSTIADVPIAGELRALADAQADVVVDFTVAAAARVTLPWLALHGIHAVVGTTGLDDDDFEALRQAFTASNCLIASNFAISAVLMMRFAELAAPHFDTAEIIELHHDNKVDAPSGTAITTAQRMAAAHPQFAADPTEHEVVAGARGGRRPRRRAPALRADARHGRPPGGDPRRARPDADHPPGQLRPLELHARRAAGVQAHRRVPRPHRRPRPLPRHLSVACHRMSGTGRTFGDSQRLRTWGRRSRRAARR